METQERLSQIGREVFPLLEGSLLAQKKKPVFHTQSYAPAPPRDRTVLQAPLRNEADGNIEFKTHTYTVYTPAFQVQSYGPAPSYDYDQTALQVPLRNEADRNMEFNTHKYTVYKPAFQVQSYVPVSPYDQTALLAPPSNGAMAIGGNMELNMRTYTVYERQTLVSMYQIPR
ncbi:hypothetical protein AAC387_Pa10g1838 [Persea americana]